MGRLKNAVLSLVAGVALGYVIARLSLGYLTRTIAGPDDMLDDALVVGLVIWPLTSLVVAVLLFWLNYRLFGPKHRPRPSSHS